MERIKTILVKPRGHGPLEEISDLGLREYSEMPVVGFGNFIQFRGYENKFKIERIHYDPAPMVIYLSEVI